MLVLFAACPVVFCIFFCRNFAWCYCGDRFPIRWVSVPAVFETRASVAGLSNLAWGLWSLVAFVAFVMFPDLFIFLSFLLCMCLHQCALLTLIVLHSVKYSSRLFSFAMPALLRSASWRCRLRELDPPSRRGLLRLPGLVEFVHVVRMPGTGVVHRFYSD